MVSDHSAPGGTDCVTEGLAGLFEGLSQPARAMVEAVLEADLAGVLGGPGEASQ